MPILRDLQQQMLEMKQQMATGDAGSSSGSEGGATATPSRPAGAESRVTTPEARPSDITPGLLRQNAMVMSQASDKLARIRWQEDEGETPAEAAKNKSGGKKSGSMLVAAETVNDRIDWPHMYVSRATSGRRLGVAYLDLTSEEFVVGYISMLSAPLRTWDCVLMIKL